MSHLNRVILIGRLTADPETRTFSTGGKVAKFRFAVNNRKKNSQTGQWEDDPMFIDCEAYNRGDYGTLANTVETYCKKGSLICLEGKLNLDQWDDKTTGQKRSKHKIVVDALHLLDRKDDGQGGGAPRGSAGTGAGAPAKAAAGGDYDDDPRQGGGGGDEIPF